MGLTYIAVGAGDNDTTSKEPNIFEQTLTADFTNSNNAFSLAGIFLSYMLVKSEAGVLILILRHTSVTTLRTNKRIIGNKELSHSATKWSLPIDKLNSYPYEMPGN